MASAKSQRRKPAQRRPLPWWSRWLLSAVLVVWAFVLGILVGQGVIASPDQIQWFNEACGLDGLVGDDPPSQPLALMKFDLSFDEDMQSGRVANPQSPPTTEKTIDEGGYHVQVASFKSRDQALTLKKKLNAAGHPAQVVETKVSGLGMRYRVRVGPYNTKSQAAQAMETFRTRYKLAGLVVKSD